MFFGPGGSPDLIRRKDGRKDLDRDDLPIIRELMKLLDYYEPVYKQIPNWQKCRQTVSDATDEQFTIEAKNNRYMTVI